jgi:hypothetical protein
VLLNTLSPEEINHTPSTALVLVGPVTRIEPPKRTLRELSDRLSEAHGEAVACVRRGVEYAVECGLLLLEMKGIVGRGDWLPHLTRLARERDISIRMLHWYMALAAAFNAGDPQICNALQNSETTLRQAIACLKSRKTKARPAPITKPIGADRDARALSELTALEQCLADLLNLLDAVEPIAKQRFLRNTAASSPWRGAAL